MLFVLTIFIAISLLIGFRASRKTISLRDYVAGAKTWTPLALIFTYLATDIDGSKVFRTPNYFIEMGICAFSGIIGLTVSAFIRYYFIAPNLSKLNFCISTGDVLKVFFGKWAQIFSGAVNTIFGLIVTAMQIQGMAIVMNFFFGVHATLAIVISSLSIAIYTGVGGMSSVVATDLFQIGLILFLGLGISHFVISEAGGVDDIIDSIPSNKLQLLNPKYFTYTIPMFFLQSLFSVEMTEGPRFQRLLLARGLRKIRTVIIGSTVGMIITSFLIAVLSFALVKLELNNTQYPVLEYIKGHSPPFIRELLIIGIIAIIFSSGDSWLHATGVALVYDFILPISGKKLKEKSLIMIKVITILLGGLCSFLAYKNLYSIKLDLLLSILASTISVPLFTSLLGLNFSQKSFFMACFIGVATLIGLKFNMLGTNVSKYASLLAAFSNLLTLLIFEINRFKKVFDHDFFQKKLYR